MPNAEPNLDLRAAWQRQDAAIERDAELFWLANKAIPPGSDAGTRLSELCAAAYIGDELVGISTTPIRTIGFLRTKLAMLRVLVAPGARVQNVARRLGVFSRDLLEAWSKENPQEGVMGLGAVIQSPLLVKNVTEAVYPETRLAFVGYTQEGFQMRVFWFAHATVSTYWPGDDVAARAEENGQPKL
jgi:hypothetical protein